MAACRARPLPRRRRSLRGIRIETFDETVRLNGLGGADSLTGVKARRGRGPHPRRWRRRRHARRPELRRRADRWRGRRHARGQRRADQISGDAGDESSPGTGRRQRLVEGGAEADRFVFRGSNIGELDRHRRAERSADHQPEHRDGRSISAASRRSSHAVGGPRRHRGQRPERNRAPTSKSTWRRRAAAAICRRHVVVRATAADDAITVEAAGGGIDGRDRGAATTRVTARRLALDELFVNGQAGNDTCSVIGPGRVADQADPQPVARVTAHGGRAIGTTPGPVQGPGVVICPGRPE